jgi:hypothetical protein
MSGLNPLLEQPISINPTNSNDIFFMIFSRHRSLCVMAHLPENRAEHSREVWRGQGHDAGT